MAQFNHPTDPDAIGLPSPRQSAGQRAATFRPSGQHAALTPASSRAATFRPHEELAARLDIIEGLRASLEADLLIGQGTPQDTLERAARLALIAELLRQPEQAIARLDALIHVGRWDSATWSLASRLWREQGDWDRALDALEGAASAAEAAGEVTHGALARLARAQMTWAMGAAPQDIIAALGKLDAAEGFARYWLDWLTVEALVADGKPDAALVVLDALAESPGLPPELRRATSLTSAVWRIALGRTEEATELLLSRVSLREPELLDALCLALFARDRFDQALDVLDRVVGSHKASLAKLDAGAALLYASLLDARREALDEAERVLAAQPAQHDVVLLAARAALIERQLHVGVEDQDQRAALCATLIEILNARLECAPAAHERVHLLLQLAALYEREVHDEAASAEVLREALALAPDHPGVLRALGRVYARQQEDEQLARLCEHEIAQLGGPQLAWRRHMQAAELYERRLRRADDALRHYRAVLAARPCYLPALKGACRVMESVGRWAELAELLLSTIPHTASTRQRLYMLDKVAEIAEHRLRNDEVACGAWEEILRLCPTHPTAYASLARLYVRLSRWDDLLVLTEQELEQVEDADEQADMCIRAAQIAQEKLGDAARAEILLRRANAILPGYVPAIEGLGRLLRAQQRWEELAALAGMEFNASQDADQQWLKLSAMAELCEEQLGRPLDAARLYEEMLRRRPEDLGAYFALRRIWRTHAEWDKEIALIQWRLGHVQDVEEAAALHGELGQLHEWRQGNRQRALEHYEAALAGDPSCPHWLDGVLRTWRAGKRQPGRLAGWLEGFLPRVRGGAEQRLKLAIARLMELDSADPAAAMHLRQSTQTLMESRLMLRLGLATGRDRAALHTLRARQPVHRWEQALSLVPTPDDGFAVALPGECALALDEHAQRLWFELLDPGAFHLPVEIPASPLARLGAELKLVLSGESLGEPAPSLSDPYRLRLRAIEARLAGELDAYASLTHREIDALTRPDIAARRLLEMASLMQTQPATRAGLLRSAALRAFPELGGGERAQQTFFDGPAIEALYEALYEAGQWDLLRSCLELHVTRPDVPSSRMIVLLDLLAEVFEDHLREPEPALLTREECWRISQDPIHLSHMVRLSESMSRTADAITHQRRYMSALATQRPNDVTARLGAGRKLAELLLAAPGREQEGLALLQELVSAWPHAPETRWLKLRLAHAHAELGDPRVAALLFSQVLDAGRIEAHLDDWRAYVALMRDQLVDPHAAYDLQWSLIRRATVEPADLALLADLADEAAALQPCARELMRLAAGRDGATKRQLLTCAASILDDQLGHSEEAALVYADLEIGAPEAERRRLMRRRAFCLARMHGKNVEAHTLFRSLLASDPFDLGALRGVANLCEQARAVDRLRVISQLRLALGDSVPSYERIRGKTVPARPLDLCDHLDALLPDALPDGVLDVLRVAMPLVQKVWPDAIPQRKALDNRKGNERALEPLAHLFETYADAIGANKAKVWLGDSSSSLTQVLYDGQPLIWVHAEQILAFDEAEARFLAAACGALAWTEIPAMIGLDGREVWHLLEGIWLRQTGKGFSGDRVDARSQELSEAVSSPFHAVARRRVAAALEPVAHLMADVHCEAWPRALEEFGWRVGLVCCGDIEAAATCLLRIDGWQGKLHEPTAQRLLQRHPHVRDLFAFALSEDYLKVRYNLGLSGRPSEL
jgi:tetratricopeptide (TPR) repeat protein